MDLPLFGPLLPRPVSPEQPRPGQWLRRGGHSCNIGVTPGRIYAGTKHLKVQAGRYQSGLLWTGYTHTHDCFWVSWLLNISSWVRIVVSSGAGPHITLSSDPDLLVVLLPLCLTDLRPTLTSRAFIKGVMAVQDCRRSLKLFNWSETSMMVSGASASFSITCLSLFTWTGKNFKIGLFIRSTGWSIQRNKQHGLNLFKWISWGILRRMEAQMKTNLDLNIFHHNS